MHWLHQVRCVIPTLKCDLPYKLGNLWKRREHLASLPEEFDPPVGSKRMLVCFHGWNLCARDSEERAPGFAKALSAGLRYMRTQPGCGNIAKLLEADPENDDLLYELAIKGWDIFCRGYSRGGLDAIMKLKRLLRRLEVEGVDYDARKVHLLCIATPILGSDLAYPQTVLMKAGRYLFRQSPFFNAVEAAAEMIPGSPALREVTEAIAELEAKGVRIRFLAFKNDGLVHPEQAAPLGQQAWVIGRSNGHTSVHVTETLEEIFEKVRDLVEQVVHAPP